ncbi:MAG: CGGC domain-containing protein [Firmicutes bacterium]|nr:CGGC domain-containing protein [Bacillota bacterium]
MKWTPQAEEALKGVPGFVRGMAKKAVEEEARKEGAEEITPELVKKAKEKYITSLFGGKSDQSEDKPTSSGDDKGEKGEEKTEKKGRKVAIIRCDIVSETCPGIACMKAWNNRKIHFEGYGPDDELIAMLTCGGCSGRRVSRMVSKLKKYGLDVVHLSSCMMLDNDDYPKCPHIDEIKKTIRAKGIEIVEGTHH